MVRPIIANHRSKLLQHGSPAFLASQTNVRLVISKTTGRRQPIMQSSRIQPESGAVTIGPDGGTWPLRLNFFFGVVTAGLFAFQAVRSCSELHRRDFCGESEQPCNLFCVSKSASH